MIDITGHSEIPPSYFSTQYVPLPSDEELRIVDIEMLITSRKTIPKEEMFKNTMIDVYRRNFWNTLANSVNRTGFTPPIGRATEILDIACGRGEDAIVLNAYFGGNHFGEESKQVHVTGIEIDKYKLELAKLIVERESQIKSSYTLLNRDASKAESYSDIPEADVVVIRNQEMQTERKPDLKSTWENIFRQAFNQVRVGGIIIITTPYYPQRALIQPILDELKADVIIDETSPHGKGSKSGEWSPDSHLTICRR